jgi:hypothetical protein
LTDKCVRQSISGHTQTKRPLTWGYSTSRETQSSLYVCNETKLNCYFIFVYNNNKEFDTVFEEALRKQML